MDCFKSSITDTRRGTGILKKCAHCRSPLNMELPFCSCCSRPNPWWAAGKPGHKSLRPSDEANRFSLCRGQAAVHDRTHDLIWQRSGSTQLVDWYEARYYLDELNHGEIDNLKWAIPSLEQLTTLLVPVRNSEGLFIDPLFDSVQRWCWTCTRNPSGGAYAVFFFPGTVLSNDLNAKAFLRAVEPDNGAKPFDPGPESIL